MNKNSIRQLYYLLSPIVVYTLAAGIIYIIGNTDEYLAIIYLVPLFTIVSLITSIILIIKGIKAEPLTDLKLFLTVIMSASVIGLTAWVSWVYITNIFP